MEKKKSSLLHEKGYGGVEDGKEEYILWSKEYLFCLENTKEMPPNYVVFRVEYNHLYSCIDLISWYSQ